MGSSPGSPGAAALRHNSPAPRCRGWVFLERKESRGSASCFTPAHQGKSGLTACSGTFPVLLLSVFPDLSRLVQHQRPRCSNWDFLEYSVLLSKRNAFGILALAVPSVLLALRAGCGRSRVATTSWTPTPQVSPLGPRQSRSRENSVFAGLRGGGDEPVENLFWTGKTERLTGAAGRNNREETTNPPTQPQTTQTGAPTQPLQRWWDVPGGVGSREGVKSKGKLLWSINTHFPHATNKLQQHPAGYFQVNTSFVPNPSAEIRYSLEKLLPRRTQLLMEGANSQSREWARGAQVPGVLQLDQGSGISISFLEQSKPDANSSTFHASAALRVSTLNPTTSKQLFTNKKVCQVLGRAQVTFPRAFPRHPTRFLFPAPCGGCVSLPPLGCLSGTPESGSQGIHYFPFLRRQKGKGNSSRPRPSAF